jgi:hypothetical protein
MPYREFRFHPGGGNLVYDDEGAAGITYGRETADAVKDVSNSIAALIKTGEWCHKCDLEFPEPIYSSTIQKTFRKALDSGQINLSGMPWSLLSGRLRETRCPACGAHMSQQMIKQVLREGRMDLDISPDDYVTPA